MERANSKNSEVKKDKEKFKVSYEDTHICVVRACSKILKDDYKPDVLIGISTGGLIVMRIAKAVFEEELEKKLPAYVIGISYYDENNQRLKEPFITQKLDSELEKKIEGTRVLMMDEIDDSRKTLETASKYILGLGAKELRILVAYMKEAPKIGTLPDCVKIYYGRKIPNCWIEYPWESKKLW
ncbi:MAG: phosphoribosyltransferase family protein [Candidatus Woesearchaeota archaeon]